MQTISTAFREALSNSHQIATKCEIWNPTSNTLLTTLRVLQSSGIDVDVDRAIRRNCTVYSMDDTGTLTPDEASDILAPYGNEMRLYRGITFSDGTVEYIPLGVFIIISVYVQDYGDAVRITLYGQDRARKVMRSKFTSPYVIAAGTNYATAIQDMITAQVTGLTYYFTSTTYTTPSITYDANQDPWEAAQKMAQSIGMQLYFDVNGACVLSPIPDPVSGTVLWEFAEGATCTMMQASRTFSSEEQPNGVIVTGESGDVAPVRAEAWDTVLTSPTYYLGNYGKVPSFISSSLVTTQAQAQATADAELLRVLSSLDTINMSAVPHPAIDGYDIIKVTRSRIGVSNTYAVTKITLPLEASDAMYLSARRRRV